MNRSRNLYVLSAIFVFAGLMHFVIPDSYTSIMPAWIPRQLELVYVSGVLEILGGIGLLVPSVRRLAGIGLILLLIAVFPANIQMLVNATHDNASWIRVAALWLRLPLQPLLIAWVYNAAVRRPSQVPLTTL